jgi:hypothetical protein
VRGWQTSLPRARVPCASCSAVQLSKCTGKSAELLNRRMLRHCMQLLEEVQSPPAARHQRPTSSTMSVRAWCWLGVAWCTGLASSARPSTWDGVWLEPPRNVPSSKSVDGPLLGECCVDRGDAHAYFVHCNMFACGHGRNRGATCSAAGGALLHTACMHAVLQTSRSRSCMNKLYQVTHWHAFLGPLGEQ